MPGRDPVRPDDSEIPPASPATNQVFIVSRDPLRAFIAALNPALRGCEELTIIVDRRRADLENVAARPAIERRHHPSVDAKVETDGFAIVPLSTTEDPPNPPWIERVVDHQSAADDAEADERELQRILEFKRRKARVGRLVRVSAIVGAVSVLVVLFAQMPAGKALVNRAQLVALPTSERTPEPLIEPRALSVVEAPAPPRPSRPPAERIGRPRDTARTPKPARPTQSNSPPRAWSGRPSASAPDPMRSSEGGPRRIAHTASTPGAPRQPSARGLEAWIQALQSRVKGDVDTAGAEAKRQIDELKSKTMRSLDEMRRVWNNTTQCFRTRTRTRCTPKRPPSRGRARPLR
jgi:hypothetical protein